MQPYPCATTTVTPVGRTALCPLRSILGAIGHIVKTKDLSAFPAGQDEPPSAFRPNRGSRAEGSQSAGKANFSFPQGRTLPRIPRISRTISVGGTHLTTHTTHITHHFRRTGRTLPRIPRISRTISVGGTHLPRIPRISRTISVSRAHPYHAYHAYHAPFPSAGRTLPRIPRISRTISVSARPLPRISRISRTISVGLLKAPEIRFPYPGELRKSSWSHRL